MTTYQTVMKRRDKDIHTNRLYWFTQIIELHPVLSQTTEYFTM